MKSTIYHDVQFIPERKLTKRVHSNNSLLSFRCTEILSHFSSFLPFKNRAWSVTRSIEQRKFAQKTEDGELGYLREVFGRNGYPKRFIEKTTGQFFERAKKTKVDKKTVCPLEKVTPSEAVDKTFYGAKLSRVVHIKTILYSCNRSSGLIMYILIYLFQSDNVRRPYDRPDRPGSRVARGLLNITGTIGSHPADSNHSTNVTETFRSIYIVQSELSRLIKSWISSVTKTKNLSVPFCLSRSISPICSVSRIWVQSASVFHALRKQIEL